MYALTVKRYKQPNLSILDPLPDTIARSLLHTRHQCGVIYYAIEDLARRPQLLRLRTGILRRAILRSRSWASGALHAFSARP